MADVHDIQATLLVKRVLSNNAAVAVDPEGNEVVALGRGVGFGARPGAALDPERVERVFVASGEAASHQMTQFLAEVPLVCVRAAAAVAELAGDRLGLTVSQSLILPLADHLHFAMQRHDQEISLQTPLRWEVRQLYPAEFATGEASVARASAILGVPLDPDEAVSFALHFVNAQFASPGLAKAARMTEIISQVIDVVERTLGISIDQDSMSASRFVTHLRYLFSRVESGKQIADPHPTFVEAIANAHPEAMGCAQKTRFLLEMGLSTTLTPDETAYLAMHIARLAWEVRAADGS